MHKNGASMSLEREVAELLSTMPFCNDWNAWVKLTVHDREMLHRLRYEGPPRDRDVARLRVLAQQRGKAT